MAPGPSTAVRHLRAFLETADPALVTSTQAATWVREFVELERLAAAGKTLFAQRASQSPTWVDEGHVNPAMWLADQAKCPLGEAVGTLVTSKALADLPETAAALRLGKLSAAQAKEVARAASHDPSAEGELLALAESSPLQALKDRATQVLAQSTSAEAEAARQRKLHEQRRVRHFTDHEGALRLDARLAPVAGGRLLAALQAETDRLFEAARKEGVHEPVGAYRADALVNLVTGSRAAGGGGPGSASGSASGGASGVKRASTRTGTVVMVKVDAEALARGHVQSGESCEIPGVGPVSVEQVRRLLPFADVWTVCTNSVDVVSVCHVGRAITGHQRMALEARDPQCVVPGCSIAYGLENHHWVEDFARSGRTSLADLARVCPRHHDMVTYQGWRLEGGPGAWRFLPPEGAGGVGLFEDTG